MFKQALSLWKKEKNRKGTTLHRRLLLFFLMVSFSVVLVFALLLSMFGITGRDAKAVENHIDTELSIMTDKLNDELGRLSLGGIALAEDFSEIADDFFRENGIRADSLGEYPELIEPLLSEYMQTLITAANTRYCGGVYVLLDASVTGESETAKAGIFIKKTQPTVTDALGVQLHYLRGPAGIARDHDIMLLGQWRMEYDITEQDFFGKVMETARTNPELSLSRLYYWSGRVLLKNNSEAGFLLCVPMRASDGTVFGVCGVEVSDRMFKALYTPEGGDFDNIFTVMAPVCDEGLCTSKGLVAGNSYLAGHRFESDFTETDSHEGFVHYATKDETFAGKTTSLRLYPGGSPYESTEWTVSILMPKDILHTAVKGNASYLHLIIVGLLILCILASWLISRHYLKPINSALDKVKNNAYAEGEDKATYSEIVDLFDYLSKKDREYDLALQQKEQETEAIRGEHEKAQSEISRLAYSRKNEIDPELYRMFLSNLRELTPTERTVFDYYLAGKSAKEIMDIMGIKEPTLKFHNRNIYSKLGITSRKELLRYAVLMKKEGDLK